MRTQKVISVKRESGFTLIEVLVSILILSLGLLGLAGLQAASIKNTSSSGQRSVAMNLANEMADRMRANPVALAGAEYVYANYIAGNAVGVKTTGCRTAAGCTTQQLARNDIFEWNAALLTWLPQVSGATVAGVVCVDSTPDDGTQAAPACDDQVIASTGTISRANYTGRLPYVIKIWWVENRNEKADLDTGLKRLSIRLEP